LPPSPLPERVAEIVGCYEISVSGRGADVVRRRLPALMELLAEGVSGRPPAKVAELGERAVRGISSGREVRVEEMRWRLVRGEGCEVVWGFGMDDDVRLKLVREGDALVGTARPPGQGSGGNSPALAVRMKRISCDELPKRE
ncbi:MAG TPA: hypothetical protein VFK70_08000, partial [Vicinamibacteria bacterium]|nr:hypothetical protein [Vicinamibacteria bacterium]